MSRNQEETSLDTKGTGTLVRPLRVGLAVAVIGIVASVGLTQQPQTSNGSGATPPAGLGQLAMSQAAVGPPVAAAGEMIGFSSSDGSGTQTITLVHTGKSWMAVYHIDRSGSIQLVSSRPIDADFSLQLNATSPLPEEIRAIGRR